MEQTPKVSILISTYNHESFISDTIEGILSQKTDFPYRVIIGEDCSTDRTGEICLRYQSRHPNRITVLDRTANLGMNGNFIDAWKHCTGKYIAVCEGDDYWTDPSKLQKQIEFLDANPDFAISFHRVAVENDQGQCTGHSPDGDFNPITSFEDLALRNYIPTLSCVFRNGLFGEIPEWFVGLAVGDYPLHLLNAAHGRIGFISETMGVYRQHGTGAWNSKQWIEKERAWLGVVEKCKEHFAPRGAAAFDDNLSRSLTNYAFLNYEAKQFSVFRASVRKLFKLNRSRQFRTVAALCLRYALSFRKDHGFQEG